MNDLKVWTIRQPGGIEMLHQENREQPTPKPGEILIEIKAAGVNRTDIITRENKNLSEPYPILGVEVSGVVVSNNSDYTHLTEGTRVAGLVNNGGYAEYVTMPANRAIVLPESISFEEGAALSEVFLTAYQTLYWLGELKKGERVLIHAGASGVGTAAIQLAKHLSEATIFTTSSKKEKLIRCKELGADVLINYKEELFDEVIQEKTDGQGVDVILDFVGAPHWEMNLASCAFDARWVLIGTLGGSQIDKLDIRDLIKKRISLKGTLLTPRSDEYKGRLTQEFMDKVMSLIEDKTIKTIIHQVVPFDDATQAHQIMENNENIGKIILSRNE